MTITAVAAAFVKFGRQASVESDVVGCRGPAGDPSSMPPALNRRTVACDPLQDDGEADHVRVRVRGDR